MKIPFLPKRAAPAKPEIMIPPAVHPADMDDEQREMVRAAAKLEAETSFAMRDRVMSEVATSLRWVQASLLLVNGGAALAVLQSQTVSAHVRTWSDAAFVVGILSSLLATTIAVERVSDAPVKFSRFAGYWISVGIDLLRVEAIEREWQEYATELQQRMRLPKKLGYVAAGSFVLGCLIVGIGTY